MQQLIKVKLKKLTNKAFDLRRATPQSAGWDVAYAGNEPAIVYPGRIEKLRTGYAFELPEHTTMLIAPRSGKATKEFLRPANTPGVLDSDYRGELFVAIENFSSFMNEPAIINPGDYIAQIIIIPYLTPMFNVSDELGETERGEGGFGHSDQPLIA